MLIGTGVPAYAVKHPGWQSRILRSAHYDTLPSYLRPRVLVHVGANNSTLCSDDFSRPPWEKTTKVVTTISDLLTPLCTSHFCTPEYLPADNLVLYKLARALKNG
jgi:hypothetical protein